MTIDPSLLYRIAFASMRGLTPALARAILARTGTEERFFSLTAEQISASLGFRNRLFDRSLRDKALREAEDEVKFIERGNIQASYFTDPTYPTRLLECDDAPLMIYTLGDCDLNDARIVSIVGTRHATSYGTSFVDDLVKGLAEKSADPVVIVSGLAYGIDVAAHLAAISAGLPTVGVLAHGLNTIYPASHRDIAARMISSGGMLLTDYRSSDNIHKGNFLARNRIIAGLCDCVVVVESDTHGGSLVTARLASAYSRDVFALPGRTSDRYSRGCNHLISSCIASLLTSYDELIDSMRWRRRVSEGEQGELFSDTPPGLSPEEQAIIDIITTRGDATINELTASIDIPTPRLMGMLVDMEFRSLIAAIPGGRYRIR
ncbi:DNA-processing protein DprA [uncultured Duncaniella sp.]|uniref:DNA-processing protein DprA n=1 Tax=uncultured Duncaniella sp. TaxID=2768039 RepID=UPI00266CE540|nr:DNA-processing protein DprA [uncultured Duncaniella sp.]